MILKVCVNHNYFVQFQFIVGSNLTVKESREIDRFTFIVGTFSRVVVAYVSRKVIQCGDRQRNFDFSKVYQKKLAIFKKIKYNICRYK